MALRGSHCLFAEHILGITLFYFNSRAFFGRMRQVCLGGSSEIVRFAVIGSGELF